MCVVVAPLLVHCFPKGGASKVCCKEGGQEGKEGKKGRSKRDSVEQAGKLPVLGKERRKGKPNNSRT